MMIFSCSNDDTQIIEKNNGLTYLIIEGNKTNEEVATQISEEAGSNTQFVWIQNNTTLTSLDLSKITNLIELKILNNTQLATLNISNLKSVHNNIEDRNNPNLTSLNLTSLISIGKSFNCNSNSNLATVNLSLLKSCGEDLIISGGYPTNSITNIDLSSLENVKSRFSIIYTLVTAISLPKLISCDFVFQIGANSLLNSINIPVLDTVGNLEIGSNPTLTSLSFPSLTAIGGFYENRIVYNSSLTSISLPNLTNKPSTFSVYDNALTSSNVNQLLSKFVAINSTFSGGSTYNFQNQNPPSPPTGQGLVDKATLISLGNTVVTD